MPKQKKYSDNCIILYSIWVIKLLVYEVFGLQAPAPLEYKALSY